MSKFRMGYLYSLAPIHCGGEGDLGNILDSVREVHTNFPYIPGSSLRGCIRDEVTCSQTDQATGKAIGDRLFGQELDSGSGTMGVHQVWFGDARLLWIPMRTVALEGIGDAFTWVSCHTLIRDHALVSQQPISAFPNYPVGTRTGSYWVADSQIRVEPMSEEQKKATALLSWASSLAGEVKSIWEKNRIVLPDGDFEVLMEHALWTQVRNKITDEEKADGKTQAGAAEVFWTDICIPRDTLLYYPWGYRLLNPTKFEEKDHTALKEIISGLLQVGGQANVGRGWVQSWVTDDSSPMISSVLGSTDGIEDTEDTEDMAVSVAIAQSTGA